MNKTTRYLNQKGVIHRWRSWSDEAKRATSSLNADPILAGLSEGSRVLFFWTWGRLATRVSCGGCCWEYGVRSLVTRIKCWPCTFLQTMHTLLLYILTINIISGSDYTYMSWFSHLEVEGSAVAVTSAQRLASIRLLFPTSTNQQTGPFQYLLGHFVTMFMATKVDIFK